MLLQWKIVMFYKGDFKIVKKIFKVSSNFKKDRQLTWGTQYHTAQNRKFWIETGGPQNKVLIQFPDILKAWVEEKTVFPWRYTSLNNLNLSKNGNLTTFSVILLTF